MEKVKVPPELKGVDIPAHIAVIMDGNGRWAMDRGKLRFNGHERGAEAVRDITRTCARIGVKRLTLFAFSAENWQRPKREVNHLMKLLKQYLISERDELMDNNIQLKTVGRVHELPEDVQNELEKSKSLVSKNTGMILCLALNYGGRQEIIDAVKQVTREIEAGVIKPDQITDVMLDKYMYEPCMEAPDLLIRTGGEMRISNFLLWHISYTEIVVLDVLWPDFTKEHLYKAIEEYSKRERRFGRVT